VRTPGGGLVDAAMAGVAARGGHQAHADGHAALLRRAARRGSCRRLAAAAAADIAELQRLFCEHGFEAWVLPDHVAPHAACERQEGGLHPGSAVVAIAALLLLLTCAVGLAA
jgi:hypothetical protein